MNKYQFLEISEYISIFGVLLGSTIAVTTGQIIYATVAIAIALLFNLVRRSQFEKQIQQRVNESHAEKYQQIADNIQSIKVLQTDYQNTYQTIQHKITALSDKIDFLQPDNNQLNNENFSELINRSQNLQETLNCLIYRMLNDGILSSYKANSLEKGIENIINQYLKDNEEFLKDDE